MNEKEHFGPVLTRGIRIGKLACFFSRRVGPDQPKFGVVAA
jgi:hypothetical protein